jgi:hypothetical protein
MSQLAGRWYATVHLHFPSFLRVEKLNEIFHKPDPMNLQAGK